MFLVVRRATLLIPSGPAADLQRKHLFVCVTDPVGESGATLLVSVSSIRPPQRYDVTCRLYRGDHPFIQHDSYVQYSTARVEPATKLVSGVERGIFVPREPMDGGVFARICRGITESRFVAHKIRVFYEETLR